MNHAARFLGIPKDSAQYENALDQQIGKIAQAQIEADAVFDANDKRRAALDCWQALAYVRNMHDQSMGRVGQEANQATSEQYSKPWAAPDTTFHTQPPAVPTPIPVPSQPAAVARAPNGDSVPQARELGAYVGTVPGGPNVYVIPPGAGP